MMPLMYDFPPILTTGPKWSLALNEMMTTEDRLEVIENCLVLMADQIDGDQGSVLAFKIERRLGRRT